LEHKLLSGSNFKEKTFETASMRTVLTFAPRGGN